MSHHDGYQSERGNTVGGTVTRIQLDRACKEPIGKGSFARVFKAMVRMHDRKTAEPVALKEPEPSAGKELKEEIDLLRSLDHPNIITMKFSFQRHGMWYVGMEFIDTGDLYKFIKKSYDSRNGLGVFLQVFGYQLFRGLAYLHSKKIVHRDLKPENVLVSDKTGLLKIIDFGCGKVLDPTKRDTYKVGTKEFRAPELLMHAVKSTPMIDVWSGGVMLTEMALGKPIFGEGPTDDTDQFFRVVKYLGYPTKEDEVDMHVKRRHANMMRQLSCCNLGQGYSRRQTKSISDRLSSSPALRPDELVDLCKCILKYSPSERLTSWEVCAHEFFSNLKKDHITLPSGHEVKGLFDFNDEELSSMPEEARNSLIK